MTTKETKYLIQMGVDQPFWLDGYDGGLQYDWTPDRKKAMRMRLDKAEQHLSQVRELLPDALLPEA